MRTSVVLPLLTALACGGSQGADTPPAPLPRALIATAPAATPEASVTVAGEGVVAYRWRLDDGAFSEPAPIETPIALERLVAGPHRLEVLGVDAAGRSQPEAEPTEHAWTVDLAWVEHAAVNGATTMDLTVALNFTGRVRYVVANVDFDSNAFTLDAIVADAHLDIAEPFTPVTETLTGLRDDTTYFTTLVPEDAAGSILTPLEQRFEHVFPARHAIGTLETAANRSVEIGYYLYRPEAYYKTTDEKFPLLVFFHGAGERGTGDTTQLSRVLRHGPPALIERGDELPFIVLSPQTHVGLEWHSLLMDEVVEFGLEDPRVDRSRVYVTGVSMGGNATWNYAIAHPEKLAAVLPISGWGTPTRVCEMRDVPVWAFHGDADETVPVTGSRQMITALERCNPPPTEAPRYTEYPGVGHNAWTRTYDNSATEEDIYAWLLMHSR